MAEHEPFSLLLCEHLSCSNLLMLKPADNVYFLVCFENLFLPCCLHRMRMN